MKALDYYIQHWRIAKAGPFIPRNSRVLDVGCGDGALFRHYKSRIVEGVGLDTTLDRLIELKNVKLLPGEFPRDANGLSSFDVITMLAVLEHLPTVLYPELAPAFVRLLRPGGYLIVTVPSSFTDHVLKLLKLLHLIDGMCLEEHHGFVAGETPAICGSEQVRLVCHKRFQLGLNNLFVFRRTES